MSNPCILFACIQEAFPSYRFARNPPDPEIFRLANDAVLAQIPEDDTWPPLVRAMVSTTGRDTLHGSFRDRRIISLVGHIDHFSSGAISWLDKFESLLRRTYWVSAEVYTFGGWDSHWCLEYWPTKETITSYSEDHPQPPHAWTLRCRGLSTHLPGSPTFMKELVNRPGFDAGDGPIP